jgi:hypothetical protein
MMNILSPDRRPLGIRIALWTPSRACSPVIRSAFVRGSVRARALGCRDRNFLGRDGFEYEYLACLTPAIAARVGRGGDKRIRAEPHGDVVVKVVLLALGSRGDVQPMVALGKALQAVGKPVTVVALRNFAPLVEAAGLSFIPVERDFDESTQAAVVKSGEKSFTRAVRAWLTDIAP